MVPTLVIIEDNKDLVEYIKEFLKEHGGLNVIGFHTGVEGLKHLKSNKPDIIIVDLQLEDIHGEALCKQIREVYSDVPIIILTGNKSQESIISCLNAGADDYITKPFNSDELLARVRARLRHVNTDSSSSVLTAGDITLNPETLEVTRGEEKITLTAKEFELLKYLLTNKFRVSTRDHILYAVWGYTAEINTRVVDVHIGKLRKKLEEGTNKTYIESVRGYGYKILGD